MLNYARQRAIEILKSPRAAVLVTSGPAGLQVGEFPCQAVDLDVYLLVPRTSDHLFNLERQPGVTLLIAGCELRGEARIIPLDALVLDLPLLCETGAEWCALVKVVPARLQVCREAGWGSVETFDIDTPPG